jgi:hypothetical protein
MNFCLIFERLQRAFYNTQHETHLDVKLARSPVAIGSDVVKVVKHHIVVVVERIAVVVVVEISKVIKTREIVRSRCVVIGQWRARCCRIHFRLSILKKVQSRHA